MSKAKLASVTKKQDLQGEGNYEAAKQYDDATRRFIQSGKVNEAVGKAAPRSAQEEREMLDAEAKGLAHAKTALKNKNKK